MAEEKENEQELQALVKAAFDDDDKDNNNNNYKSVEEDTDADSDDSLIIDRPMTFRVPSECNNQQITTCCNGDVRIRLARWSFITLIPLFVLIMLQSTDRMPLSFHIGLALLAMYIIYFMVISFYFWSGTIKNRHLYRVYTRPAKVPGWADMHIAEHQQLYKFEAIQSISEFSAIDGGVPAMMISNLGPFTWAVVTMHFAAQMEYNSEVFRWDVTDVFEIIGVSGLVMIGIFELDPYNAPMRRFHNFGALSGIGTLVGMVIQAWSLSKQSDNYVTFAVKLSVAVIGMFFAFLWNYNTVKRTVDYENWIKDEFLSKGKKPKGQELADIRKQITRLSIQNVLFEGIFLFSGALSMSIWLMNYHKSCELGCAGLKTS